MSAASIAAALGGRYRSGAWWRCRCPVHNSRGATLALRDGDWGLTAKCWAGCPSTDILAELRRRGLIGGSLAGDVVPRDLTDIARRRETEARHRQQRLALARDIISASLPAAGTPIERYLSERVPGIEAIPPVLRFLPPMSVYARHPSGSRRPVMVAAVRHVEHGIIGTHRTWLRPDGSGKAAVDPVRISTGPIGGGAVQLAPPAETMMVGEGVETCVAAMQATAHPAWAALSTSGLVALVLPPLPFAARVVLLADHDTSGAGERAARTAAARWIAEGRLVHIAMPPEPGTDFADVLLGRTDARAMEAADVAD